MVYLINNNIILINRYFCDYKTQYLYKIFIINALLVALDNNSINNYQVFKLSNCAKTVCQHLSALKEQTIGNYLKTSARTLRKCLHV